MKYLLILLFSTLMIQLSIAQNALHFDGSNDKVQTTFSGISGNAARTVEAWIKTTAVAPGNQQVIMDYGVFTTGGRFTFNVLWSNAIRIEVGGSGLSGHIAVNDGNWHHVAGVYDPNATNKISLYVDGLLDTAGNIPTTVNTGSSVNLRIGERIDNVNQFTGSIDEVRVWNVARSATQIANDRNTEFCSLPPNMVAYYNLNHGTASGSNSGINKAFDAVSGKDGTLSGFSLSGSSSNWVTGSGIGAGLDVSKITATTCDSFVSPSGNFVWTTSGNYQDTLTNISNCDSLINVNLTINNGLYSVVNDTVCHPYVSPSGKYTYMTSGKYFDTTFTSKGCLHVHELNLGVTVIDTSVTKTGHQLSSNQSGGSHYIWLDCNADFSQIGGSNNQVFNPTKDGSYACRVTFNNCIDTSECVDVIGVGFDELLSGNQFNIYPNPSSDFLNIELAQERIEIQIEITSIDGKVLVSKTYDSMKSISFNTSEFEEGMYVLLIKTEGKVFFKRLTIKH